MAQISNNDQIKEQTGYIPGEVYLYGRKESNSINAIKSTKTWKGKDLHGKDRGKGIYDTNSGNFHIVPDDNEIRSKYLNHINDAINNLKTAINKALSKKDPKLKCSCGRGVPGTHLDIEKYISFTRNGYKYMLCFERLYKDDGKINSLLGAFQFYRQPEKMYIFYPESCKDGEKTPAKNDILQFTIHNPNGLPSVEEAANGKGVDAVCNAFIEFIFGKAE